MCVSVQKCTVFECVSVQVCVRVCQCVSVRECMRVCECVRMQASMQTEDGITTVVNGSLTRLV